MSKNAEAYLVYGVQAPVNVKERCADLEALLLEAGEDDRFKQFQPHGTMIGLLDGEFWIVAWVAYACDWRGPANVDFLSLQEMGGACERIRETCQMLGWDPRDGKIGWKLIAILDG